MGKNYSKGREEMSDFFKKSDIFRADYRSGEMPPVNWSMRFNSSSLKLIFFSAATFSSTCFTLDAPMSALVMARQTQHPY